MLGIRLDLGNAPSVLEALRNPENAQRISNVAAESFTDDMLNWIADGKSFTSHTGQLEQSIGWRGLGNGGAEIYANAESAFWIEEGTRPHVILPKDRQALKIPVVGGGGYILRKKVNHPGSQAKPFFFADMATREENMQNSALSVLAGIIANG